MDRDEYLIFNMPLHTLPQYIAAHQLAGTLELVKDDSNIPNLPRGQDTELELSRLARVRSGRAGVRYRK